MPEARIPVARSPRYAQLATFMRLPYAAEPAGRDVVVVGAPYDGGASYRPGARFGPRAIREASTLLHGIGIDRGADMFDLLAVADGGDLDLSPFGQELAIEQATRSLTNL